MVPFHENLSRGPDTTGFGKTRRAVQHPWSDDARHPTKPQSNPAPWLRGRQDGVWVVVAEFAARAGNRFRPDEIEALMGYLALWQPTGLWDPARYAIQLRVPAPSSEEALRRALAHHDEAARAAGLPIATLARAEVLTVEELEQSWDDDLGSEAIADIAGCHELLLADVYSATRRLMAATTPGEVAAIVAQFVTTVGGTIEPGVPRYVPGTVDIDLRIDGGETVRATAEALSVAGLMLESVLPTLLTDARLVLARLLQHQP